MVGSFTLFLMLAVFLSQKVHYTMFGKLRCISKGYLVEMSRVCNCFGERFCFMYIVKSFFYCMEIFKLLSYNCRGLNDHVKKCQLCLWLKGQM